MRSLVRAWCFSLVVLGLAGSVLKAQDAARQTEVPLHGGRANSGLLFQAVADDLHWIAGSVAGFTRVFAADTEVSREIESIAVDDLVNKFPSAFSYRLNSEGEPTSLIVDNEALAQLLADKKSRLRNWLAGVRKVELSGLTQVPNTWPDSSTSPRRIVVAMSGVHGIVESAVALAEALHAKNNLPMCVFNYPNDAPMLESARRLVAELEELHRKYPRSKVTLVAHSFGGLVARAALELNDAADVRRSSICMRTGVDQLIQVCPPNHGSALSDYAPLLEAVEQVSRLTNRGSSHEQRQLLGMITDGFNEAAQDLDPRSPSLTELNGHDRNPQVRYAILAGNDGPLRGGMTTLMGMVWGTIADSAEEPAEIDRRVREVIQCPELQKGSGDGVVSLASAKLDGVVDYEVLPMHHLTWSQLQKPAGKELVEAISRRLGISL